MRWPDMSAGARNAALFLFCFTLVLFAANLLFTAHEVHRTTAAFAAAQRATASTMQLCEAGNEARAQQYGLWAYLIHLSRPPPTKEARAVLAKFEHHLTVVFAPRNCHAITR